MYVQGIELIVSKLLLYCSSQLHVMQLLKDFGVEVYPQFMEGRNKLIIDNISDIRTYSGLIPKLGIFELLNLHRFLEKVRFDD